MFCKYDALYLFYSRSSVYVTWLFWSNHDRVITTAVKARLVLLAQLQGFRARSSQLCWSILFFTLFSVKVS